MSDLNPRQRRAVRYIDGPLLVLAGAGSGKTRVITEKICHLIDRTGHDARNIAAVTFTNKAAREMKARVGQRLDKKRTRGLRVSTFHSLGLDILRKEVAAAGYKPGFSIFDAQDAATLVRELLRKEAGDTTMAEQVQWRISGWKNDLVDPEAALAAAGDDPALHAAAKLYSAYQRHLRAYNAVDLDDLILQPVRLFDREPEVLDRWQNRIRYLLVDEYQDTNATQYELVRRLVGPRGALTVVGDDDQSIYAWRGARPENLARLQKDFPRLEVIKLEQNYRSTGCILKTANHLIRNNPHVFDKSLWSELGYGEPIRILSTRDDEHEAERVVSEILHHRFQSRADYRDYAILYRGNHQSRIFERVLREHHIPYYLSGGTSFFAYTEVKDLMAYMRLLTNPDDDAAFLRVVNTPRREIGPATMEKLGAYATGRGISLFAAGFELGLAEHLSERALTRLRRFCEWLVDVGDRAQRGDPIAAVRDLVREIDYETWLRDTCKDERAAERKTENIHDLIGWLEGLAERDSGDPTLADLVAKATLLDILDRDEDDEVGDRVHLMTLHAVKGLEFPYVFLTGMEEELLPHRTSIEEETIEEERRLCYVGITRARKALVMTLARRRRRYGELVVCEPSRFLQELPEDDVRWEGAGIEAPPEERQERGQAHLANIRGMLEGT